MASPEAAEPPETAAVRPILMGSPAWDADRKDTADRQNQQQERDASHGNLLLG